MKDTEYCLQRIKRKQLPTKNLFWFKISFKNRGEFQIFLVKKKTERTHEWQAYTK